jgi:N-acetylglucosaminyl-diphospho-decaprenol L-rhamnosyltransferase
MGHGCAIVIAHNSAACIEECLRAVCLQDGWEILLVDNASSDDTLARANKFAAQVVVIANQRNRGFAAAVNQALAASTASKAVVLNPDAVPAPHALDQIAAAMATPSVGAVGGLLVGNDGKAQQGFVIRRFPSLAAMVCEIVLLNRLWPRNPWNRRYRCLDADYSKAQVVDQPAGAALGFRREVWQELGGFDEEFYPVWFEDVDFCRRIRDCGWQILYEPFAIFRHSGGHSVERLSFSNRQLFWYRNLLLYFRKHHGRGQSLALRISIATGMIMRCAAVLAGAGPPSVSKGEALRAYTLVLGQCWHHERIGKEPA